VPGFRHVLGGLLRLPQYVRPAPRPCGGASASEESFWGLGKRGSDGVEPPARHSVRPLLEHRVGASGRAHNDANMVSIGQRMVSIEEAFEIVKTWLRRPSMAAVTSAGSGRSTRSRARGPGAGNGAPAGGAPSALFPPRLARIADIE